MTSYIPRSSITSSIRWGALERIRHITKQDTQRIGLSATVGNPDNLLRWLSGPSARESVIVAPPGGPPAEADVEIDFVGNLQNVARVLKILYRGEKRLVFCDSRARTEELATYLRSEGVPTFVSHSSLSAEQRRDAEEAFREARDCVIVATSTLELGIDVGDLDRVVQLDAPGISKYCDHLPLYRQSAILEREAGLEIRRATLDGWVMRVAAQKRAPSDK